MDKKKEMGIIILIVCVVVIVLVLMIGDKLSKKKENEEPIFKQYDVNEVDNVETVDNNLKKGDYRVTQAYLYNYTRRKSSVWYRSTAVVSKIKDKDTYYDLYLVSTTDKSKTIIAHIAKDGMKVKKKDVVNFVGTIDMSDGSINLAKISKEEIDYSSVVDMDFDELYDNIYYLKNTYVIVSGYMITAGNLFKLYDSKENYKASEEKLEYFLIEWQDEFPYTGNQDVLLRCFIGDTYKLIGCELEK